MTQKLDTQDVLTTLISLAQAAEARNPLTKDHSERVAQVAHYIGEELELPTQKLERLLLMGRLHNIGKTGIRDSVLLKTEKLNDTEYTHVKNHTILGAQLLAPIKELEDVAEVCLTHHERWDGSGYPHGLRGEEIPLATRLISTADVYVAIISERPHRDSMPEPVAADILNEEKGTLLCPLCVEAFQKWFDKTGGKIDI
ncbi:HD domain-containing phosphohydrolase [uncultured Pseudodesulfovibrio sp.]|uniref:HD-GYP domain-containing protein n=1 Tax=uncultured Pseudodesulfovibrio sp. TaxID=2035858 RepID=UPI0029C92238|nr:HD domain-containing phosphohydrolase [uncultured Pseudodesulfovibrio sp.]